MSMKWVGSITIDRISAGFWFAESATTLKPALGVVTLGRKSDSGLETLLHFLQRLREGA